MPIALILGFIQGLIKYGPDGIAAGKQIVALVKANHAGLTADDIALLDSFDKTAAQYLADAGGAPAAPVVMPHAAD